MNKIYFLLLISSYCLSMEYDRLPEDETRKQIQIVLGVHVISVKEYRLTEVHRRITGFIIDGNGLPCGATATISTNGKIKIVPVIETSRHSKINGKSFSTSCTKLKPYTISTGNTAILLIQWTNDWSLCVKRVS